MTWPVSHLVPSRRVLCYHKVVGRVGIVEHKESGRTLFIDHIRR